MESGFCAIRYVFSDSYCVKKASLVKGRWQKSLIFDGRIVEFL